MSGHRIIFLTVAITWIVSTMAQERNLSYYVSQGVCNSPLIQDYRLQMASNRVDSMKIKGTFKPQVGLVGQLYYTPDIKGYGYDAAVTNGGNYQAQILAKQELIIRKAKRTQLEALNIQSQYLDNTAKITELDLTKAITDLYITAYRDYALIQSADEVLSLLSKEEETLKPLVQKGIYNQTDYLNIQMSKETQLLAKRQADLQYRTDLYSLTIVCGMDDTSYVTLAAPVVDLSERVATANLLLLRQYHIDSLKFSNNKKLINLQYQPKLTAFADAGLWTADLPGFYRGFGAGVGVNFSMPLYDGKQRKYDYQKIDLAAQISRGYQQYYRNQYQQQVYQLDAQLRATDDLIRETTRQLKLSNDLIDVYRTELAQGLVRITDLVLTVNNYINFRTSLNQTTMSRLQIINQLNYYK